MYPTPTTHRRRPRQGPQPSPRPTDPPTKQGGGEATARRAGRKSKGGGGAAPEGPKGARAEAGPGARAGAAAPAGEAPPPTSSLPDKAPEGLIVSEGVPGPTLFGVEVGGVLDAGLFDILPVDVLRVLRHPGTVGHGVALPAEGDKVLRMIGAALRAVDDVVDL